MEFKESHRFKVWIRISTILIGLATFSPFGYGFYKQIIHGQLFGDRPMSNGELIVVFLLTLLLLIVFTIFFGFSKLTVEINENIIKYKFSPIHSKFRVVNWDMIKDYELGTTFELSNKISKYKQKHNLKYSFNYMSFDNGLVLYLKNNKLILIGIKDVEKLSEYLDKMK